METIGNIDLVPPGRRIGGQGASYLMAPFTHVSTDRPSRFSDGGFGVLYVGKTFEVALFETMHRHARFMAATAEQPGRTSRFREIVLDIDAQLHDIGDTPGNGPILAPDDYTESQALGSRLRSLGSDGIAYPSVRGGRRCLVADTSGLMGNLPGKFRGTAAGYKAQQMQQARGLDFPWTYIDILPVSLDEVSRDRNLARGVLCDYCFFGGPTKTQLRSDIPEG
jgi:hypothetical protein